MNKTAVQMEIVGLEEMRSMLNDIAPNLTRTVLRQTVHGVAGQVRDEMKKRVPVRTGRLKKSIRAVRKRGTPNHPVSQVRGGHNAPYMHIVEWGTKRTKAQPFIIPSVEAIRPKLKQIFQEEFFKRLAKSLQRQAKAKAKKR